MSKYCFICGKAILVHAKPHPTNKKLWVHKHCKVPKSIYALPRAEKPWKPLQYFKEAR